MTCVIKDNTKTYPQIILDEALHIKRGKKHDIKEDGKIGACQKTKRKKQNHFFIEET